MKMSEKIDQLIAALAKAQVQFSEPKKTKLAYNYKYAPMDEVREAVKDALSANGIFVYQHPIQKAHNVVVGDKERRVQEIGVETLLAHESGQYIISNFSTEFEKINAQDAGSAITYYRRYCVMAALGIAPEDDDGERAKPKHQSPLPLSKEEKAEKVRLTVLQQVSKLWQEYQKEHGDMWQAEFLQDFKLKDKAEIRSADVNKLKEMKEWFND